MHTTITNGIGSVKRELWDDLARDEDLPSQYSFIQMRETVSKPGLVFAVGNADGRYDAAVYAARMEEDDTGYCRPARMLISRDGLRLREDEGPFESLRARWGLASATTDHALVRLRDIAQQKLFPALVVFTPVETRFLVRPGATRSERDALTETLLAGLTEYAREHGCRSMLVLGTSDSDAELNGALRAAGLSSAMMSKAARLDLTGLASLEDFTASLAKKKRYRVTSEAREFEALGIEVRQLDPVASAGQCARLESAVMERYGASKSIERLTRARIEEARCFGDSLEVFGCLDGVEVIACVTVYASKRRYTVGAYGADHDRIGDRPVYQHLVYRVPLSRALAAGSRELCLGFESYRAKLNRGAVLDGRLAFAAALTEEGKQFLDDILSFADAQNQRYFGQFDLDSRR